MSTAAVRGRGVAEGGRRCVECTANRTLREDRRETRGGTKMVRQSPTYRHRADRYLVKADWHRRNGGLYTLSRRLEGISRRSWVVHLDGRWRDWRRREELGICPEILRKGTHGGTGRNRNTRHVASHRNATLRLMGCPSDARDTRPVTTVTTEKRASPEARPATDGGSLSRG